MVQANTMDWVRWCQVVAIVDVLHGENPSPPHIAPSKPQNLMVEGVVGELALKASWDTPSDNGGRPVESYTIQIREVVETTTSTDFTALTPLPVINASQVQFTYNIRDSLNFPLTKNTLYEWALLNVTIDIPCCLKWDSNSRPSVSKAPVSC